VAQYTFWSIAWRAQENYEYLKISSLYKDVKCAVSCHANGVLVLFHSQRGNTVQRRLSLAALQSQVEIN
jgi:hypothetical protein